MEKYLKSHMYSYELTSQFFTEGRLPLICLDNIFL